MDTTTFGRMKWGAEQFVLDDLVFRLEQTGADPRQRDRSFAFFKNRPLVDLYERFLSARPGPRPRNVLELGIFDGGSTAWWFEVLQPDHLVAVDLAATGDSPYFRAYVESRGLADRITTCWSTDQADAAALRAIVAARLRGPLDLVIDDGSHIYGPTRSSFETLFPLLRPGGLYVIEDWAWEHARMFHRPGNPFAGMASLTRLVTELVELTGSALEHGWERESEAIVEQVSVWRGFAAIERGPRVFADPAAFHLDEHIVRRPPEVLPPGPREQQAGRPDPTSRAHR